MFYTGPLVSISLRIIRICALATGQLVSTNAAHQRGRIINATRFARSRLRVVGPIFAPVPRKTILKPPQQKHQPPLHNITGDNNDATATCHRRGTMAAGSGFFIYLARSLSRHITAISQAHKAAAFGPSNRLIDSNGRRPRFSHPIEWGLLNRMAHLNISGRADFDR